MVLNARGADTAEHYFTTVAMHNAVAIAMHEHYFIAVAMHEHDPNTVKKFDQRVFTARYWTGILAVST
jgi:hypothetical protein